MQFGSRSSSSSSSSSSGGGGGGGGSFGSRNGRKREQAAAGSALKGFGSDPVMERSFRGHKGAVRCVSFNPSMKQIASGADDHVLTLWNFKPDLRAFRFVGHTAPILAVDFSPSGRLVASGSKDGTVRLWQPRVKGRCSIINAHTSAAAYSVRFSSDDRYLVSSSNDKCVKIWEVETQKFHSSFIGHLHWVRSADFSRDIRLVISGGDDKTVRLWDSHSGDNIHTFYDHIGTVNSVQFSPNGTLVAAGSADRSIKLWDIRTYKLLQHYDAHSEQVNSIGFHPSNDFLVSAGDDHTIKMWDLREGHQMYTIHGHDGPVNSVAFSPGGDFFASSGEDRNVMVWRTNFVKALGKAAQAQTTRASSAMRNREISFSSVPPETVPICGQRLPTFPSPPGAPLENRTFQEVENIPVQPKDSTFHRSNEPEGIKSQTTPSMDLHDKKKQDFAATTSGGISEDIASTLSQIVNQLEVIRQTMSLFDQRLSLQESMVNSLTSRQQKHEPTKESGLDNLSNLQI